ncbi:MAG TPA: hypothetical protein VM328_12725 [Fimbriimonadaceae bacterium]|nr:hypothetical protein [Fimbriimonadaceae bacterium]
MGSDLCRAAGFLDSLRISPNGPFSFVPGKGPSLYGTTFALLGRYYLGRDLRPDEVPLPFLEAHLDPETGYYAGPDLEEIRLPAYDRLHLMQHLTCHVLPLLDLLGVMPPPLQHARRYLDLDYLQEWLDRRDLSNPWLEGNNLLFVGQFLVHLRDVERAPGAQDALNVWFDWHDQRVDPDTGMWGSDGLCDHFKAMCGGYHQLLVYYFEKHPVASPERLVDVTLSLQHPDGGFAPWGGGGACEDADAVDILVNLYKLQDYRRGDIRAALRRTLRSILELQNDDGGFPYNRGGSWTYMSMGNTEAGPGQSHAFGTWFRVHTLALIAQILDDPALTGIGFRFNRVLSMGWHRPWSNEAKVQACTGSESAYERSLRLRYLRWRAKRVLGAVKRRISS